MDRKSIINYSYLSDLFSHLYERVDLLEKLADHPVLEGYGDSETHCIDAIGSIESSNVTNIANKLKMTTGAISKITKRLVNDGLIYRYKNEGNKKEVYFGLTKKGQAIYDAHKERHAAWEERESEFFDTVSPETLLTVANFISDLNEYLTKKIDEKVKIKQSKAQRSTSNK